MKATSTSRGPISTKLQKENECQIFELFLFGKERENEHVGQVYRKLEQNVLQSFLDHITVLLSEDFSLERSFIERGGKCLKTIRN